MSRTLICLALCVSGIACSDLHSGPLTVLVHPGTQSVQAGAQQDFVAEVRGSLNPSVVWSVQEANGGAIDQLGVYTAPAALGVYHVVATADADHATYGVSTVTVVAAPIVIGVAVSPASASLTEGGTQQFTAALTNTQIDGVIWSVVEGNGGSIGTDGTYIAPAIEGVFHVTATSIADRTSSGTAEVVVTSPDGGVFVNISPATSVSARSSVTAFTATVSGEANNAVTWSVVEADGGTIDANGNYTSPDADGVFHIQATSVAATSAVGTAVVTVTDERVSIAPQSVTLDPGGTQQFTATLENNPTMQTQALFTVASGGGTISAAGAYTAPTAAGIYSVVAATPDGLFTASAQVIVSPKIAGTISYAGAQTGRVYVEAYQQLVGGSHSIALGSTSLAAPGAYVINGVPLRGGPSTITVIAWMDTTNNSPEPIATDPLGDAVTSISAAASVAGADVALSDPSSSAIDAPDAAPAVFPGDGAALVTWDSIVNGDGNPEANHYRLFAIPVAAGVTACTSNAGANELDVPAWIPTYAVMSGLVNGGSYCFAFCGSANGGDGPLSAFTTPITIGLPSTGVTVSGSVSYSGFTPAGSLLVIARDDDDGLAGFTRIPAPTSTPASFTLSGLQNGSYQLTALFDQNSNGFADPTEPTNADELVPASFSVNGAALSGLTINVAALDANVQVSTDHYLDDTTANSEESTVYATIDPGLKLPVFVHLVSGTGAIPSDLPLASYASYGPAEWFFTRNSSGAPTVNGSFQLSVTFSDATIESFSASAVYVPVVTNVAPANGATAASDAPAISWAPPNPLPASFSTMILVTSADDNDSTQWQSAPLPSGTSSVAYNVDGTGTALVSGSSYYLTVEITDAAGDTSERNSVFTAP